MKRLAYQTLSSETQVLTGVDRVVLPLKQPGSEPLKPCVTVGQGVERGQRIGETEQAEGAFLHSPLSGEVKSVFHMLLQDGSSIEAVVIEGEAQVPVQTLAPLKEEVTALKSRDILTRLREAGVGLMGGNGKNAQYATLCHEDPPPDTILVLCTDEEPLLKTQSQILQDTPEKVLEGAALVQKAVGAKRLVFAITEDQKDLVSGEILLVQKRYPGALPEMLMAEVTGKFVLKEGGPRKDIHLINAETAVAAREAVREGCPVVEKLVTVGLDDGKASLLRVPLGTPFSRLLAQAGLETREGDRLFTGGPLRGQAQFDTERPVSRGTDGLFLQKGKRVVLYGDVACISCGACVKACPMKIPVNMMTRNCEYGRIQEAVAYDLESCIECGLCAFVCTARRPLLQYILFAKNEKQKLERVQQETPEGQE